MKTCIYNGGDFSPYDITANIVWIQKKNCRTQKWNVLCSIPGDINALESYIKYI